MKHSYWVSYQFKAPDGSGYGDLEITTEGRMAADSIPAIKALIQGRPGMPTGASVIVLAISKFE
jgi:hypothetical protein